MKFAITMFILVARTQNKEFSAMLAAAYILIEISLISCSPRWTNTTELWNITSAFYHYSATLIFRFLATGICAQRTAEEISGPYTNSYDLTYSRLYIFEDNAFEYTSSGHLGFGDTVRGNYSISRHNIILKYTIRE